MTLLVKALLAQTWWPEFLRTVEGESQLLSYSLYSLFSIAMIKDLGQDNLWNKRVHLDFWFQGDTNPSCPRRDRHGCWGSKLRTHISNHKQGTDRAKRVKNRWGFSLLKSAPSPPPPVGILSPARPHLLDLPKQCHHWGPRIQML